MAERFNKPCYCGGYAWNMNGRNPDDPHMNWCPQRKEYLDYITSMKRKENEK